MGNQLAPKQTCYKPPNPAMTPAGAGKASDSMIHNQRFPTPFRHNTHKWY